MTGKPVGSPGGAPSPSGDAEGRTSVGEFAGLGLQFAASIIVFLYAGQWLDRKLGTAPWLLMIGVFVGAGASFYSMYRKLMAAQAREEAAKAARRAEKTP
jgi:ATP synthase protein I